MEYYKKLVHELMFYLFIFPFSHILWEKILLLLGNLFSYIMKISSHNIKEYFPAICGISGTNACFQLGS